MYTFQNSRAIQNSDSLLFMPIEKDYQYYYYLYIFNITILFYLKNDFLIMIVTNCRFSLRAVNTGGTLNMNPSERFFAKLRKLTVYLETESNNLLHTSQNLKDDDGKLPGNVLKLLIK